MQQRLAPRRIKLILFLLFLFVFTLQVRAEEPEADEWTVMFYICGSDLESKYSFATGNLEEISQVHYPDSILPMIYDYYGLEGEKENITKLGKVNILLQTGGSEEWHAEDLELDIRTDAIQRFRYSTDSFEEWLKTDRENRHDFELLDTLPLQSMADPETLSDFIRWSAATYPAKKYALVLWDHGGGAKTGLFLDELFKGDVMYLYELKQTLADGGVRLEALLIDACLMANIETAWTVKDSANYLISSEEVVPGQGTAIAMWLQALLDYPACDGKWLGRTICDMTAIKYANESDALGRSLLTWSVIDLSRIDALVDAFGEFFQKLDYAVLHYPSIIKLYSDFIYRADEYGDGAQNMRDLGGVINNSGRIYLGGRSLKEAVSKRRRPAVLARAGICLWRTPKHEQVGRKAGLRMF